jgi:hypothetical protein
MDENGTNRHGPQLPMTLGTPRERLRLTHPAAPSADFISQLIAEDQHLPPQRQRRRAAVGDAVDAYATVSRSAVRRMPAGYRTTMIV